MLKHFVNQRKELKALAFILTTIAIIFVVLIFQTRIALDFLFHDVSAQIQAPVYIGIFSNAGIFAWISTATICLFMGAYSSRKKWPWKDRLRWLYAGSLFLLLGLDDAFLLHEIVFPSLFKLPETVTFIVYLALIFGFLVIFRDRLIRTNFIVLLIAIGFMGLSGFVDVLGHSLSELYYGNFSGGAVVEESAEDSSMPDEYGVFDGSGTLPDTTVRYNVEDIAEDGPKFVSIIVFLFYFAVTALDDLEHIPDLPVTTPRKLFIASPHWQ